MTRQRRKKGDGGLYPTTIRAHGDTYRYFVADWKDKNGKRHRAMGATPEQALARKNAKIQAMANPVPRSTARLRKPTGPTVEETAEMRLAADQRLGATSRAKYRSNLRLHAFPFIGSLPIRKLDVTAISRMTELQHEQSTGESAAWHTWKTLHTMLAWAVRAHLIAENPMDFMDPPRRTNHRSEHIDRYIDTHTDTALGIIAWAGEDDSPIHRYYPLIMAMGLGLRRAEVLGLTRDAFDLGTYSLAVRARLMQKPGGGYFLLSSTKNQHSRVVPLPQPFYKALLQAYNQHQDDAATLPIEDAGGITIGEGQLLLVREDGSPIPYNAWNATWRHIQQEFKDHIQGTHTHSAKPSTSSPTK